MDPPHTGRKETFIAINLKHSYTYDRSQQLAYSKRLFVEP